MDTVKTCENEKCGNSFVAERASRRFCSDACRALWGRNRPSRRKARPLPLLARRYS